MWGRGRGIAAEVRACAVDELRIGSAMMYSGRTPTEV